MQGQGSVLGPLLFSLYTTPLSVTDWFHGFHPARVRKSLALKTLVSAADLASSADFWAHFNIVTYLLTYLQCKPDGVLFIRAAFCVLLVYVAVCSVFWLLWLSRQYLPRDWLERLLWGSLIAARDHLHKAHAKECLWFSWFNVSHHCFMMCLSCRPALRDIFHTPMPQYSLFMDARSAMRPCYILPMFFIFFFMTALIGETAERIFTKLSHVVDIRCYLRTY